ncbi:metallophosphoesterase family protein [Methylomonas sp. 2BW1-5-20]|uniref:metallophosphoesterase family protein n=1 Tax=Methylomonas sp. 2BW1-5-20 TaxID=3376686 RepID=UPI00404D4D1E
MFDSITNALKRQNILAVSFSMVAAIQAAPSYAVTAADPVVLTFSTVGDSRQDPQNIDPSVAQPDQVGNGNCPIPSGNGLTPNPGLSGQDCKWLQNTKAWSRIMRAIQSQKANLLFFNGDMTMGYGKAGVPVARTSNGVGEAAIANPSVSDIVTSDLMQFYQQYSFWRGMVANMMETGTYVVPVPGNHETQCKRCSKAAQIENENAWRDNMGDLILDASRLTNLLGVAPQNWDVNNVPGVADSITTDQKQLSYSFDIGTSHFVVINTDAVGRDGRAPYNWLEADLTAAENHGAKRIFVFGHKSYTFYDFPTSAPSSTSSLKNKNVADADAFWHVIAKHNATYFCGHEHIYNVKSYLDLTSGKSAYQVLVGAGGSPFEAAPNTLGLKPSDRMYSWATVKIYQSGKVVMDTYGFDDTMANPVVKLETIQLPTLP